MSYRYLLGLGSNERPEERMSAMVDALLKDFGDLILSPVCRTEAVGTDSPAYLNAVASIESRLPLPLLRDRCKAIESALGRVRPSKSCAADIDILACWQQPRPTRAEDFIQEPYFLPQAGSVLEYLGLALPGSVASARLNNRVPLTLIDGRSVGENTVQLQSA